MGHTRISQMSFSRGEIAPALQNRTDIEQYSISLKTLKNGFVHQEGCVSNRSGFEFVGQVKEDSFRSSLTQNKLTSLKQVKNISGLFKTAVI